MIRDWSGCKARRWRGTAGRLALGLVLLWGALVAWRLGGVAVQGRAAAHAARQVWAGRGALELGGADQGQQLAAARELRMRLEGLEQHLEALTRLVQPLACPLARQGVWPAAQRAGIVGCDGARLAAGLARTAWWAALELESATELYGQVTTTPGVPHQYRDDPLDRALTHLGRDRQSLLALRPAAVRVGEALRQAGWPGRRLRALADLPLLAVDGLLLAPELLGGGQERLFLVVVQNSDELRATGGFVSSVVAVRMRGWRLLDLAYMDSYDVETPGYVMPPPPEPLAVHMRLPGLVFRDANWSPDWPTSAQVLAALYQASRGGVVHAVIGIDTTLLHLALEALGPIPVPEYGVTITAANLLETAETFWETPQEGASLAERTVNLWSWLQHRKDFGGVFVQAGLARLEQLSPREGLALVSALLEGAHRRHLQIWALQSQSAQEDLARAGWAGALYQGEGDLLLVVDSNLGFNKVDRNIEREIEYSLALRQDVLLATVRLRYRNHAPARPEACFHAPQVLESYQALTEQCYWNYVRVYAPRGVELIEAAGGEHAVDIGLEQGRASLGVLVVVPPQEERVVTLLYRLPDGPVSCHEGLCRYQLYAQKQAGSLATPLRVSADVTPVRVEAPGWVRGEGPLTLTTTLETDRSFTVVWRAGQR